MWARIDKRFIERALPDYPDQARWYPSLCRTSQRHAFLIGGHVEQDYWLNTCLRFDVIKSRWEQMPSMNKARQMCSSCALAGHLYVFCGYNYNGDLHSIEKLRIVKSCSEQKMEAWEVIQTSIDSDFRVQRLVVACPLDETRILIMGGKTGFRTDTMKVHELDT